MEEGLKGALKRVSVFVFILYRNKTSQYLIRERQLLQAWNLKNSQNSSRMRFGH
jgi:penicillin-binding protein-related factor A (putative recombinase)